MAELSSIESGPTADSGAAIGAARCVPVLRASDPRPASYWADAHLILDEVTRYFGMAALRVLDGASRAWFEWARSPHLGELRAFASKVNRPGVYFLNLSYEWACTVMISGRSDGEVRMQRVFDWGPVTLGRTLCAIHRSPHGSVGSYVSLTWPLFVGEVTAIAAGRFAVALNSAPRLRWWPKHSLLPKGPLPPMVSRMLGITGWAPRRSLPPAHLLRKVFEEAATATDAIRMLRAIPCCAPAIFCVAGRNLAESGVVERRYDGTRFLPAPVCTANDWHDGREAKFGYGDSPTRIAALRQRDGETDLAHWCVAPILNTNTRYAADLCAGDATLSVVTIQDEGFHSKVTTIPLAESPPPAFPTAPAAPSVA